MAAAWPADDIVMGSHGRRGMNRLLLGSVSEGVVRHATCSVQVVPKRFRPRRRRPDGFVTTTRRHGHEAHHELEVGHDR